jgi:hypothetical protein
LSDALTGVSEMTMLGIGGALRREQAAQACMAGEVTEGNRRIVERFITKGVLGVGSTYFTSSATPVSSIMPQPCSSRGY